MKSPTISGKLVIVDENNRFVGFIKVNSLVLKHFFEKFPKLKIFRKTGTQ